MPRKTSRDLDSVTLPPDWLRRVGQTLALGAGALVVVPSQAVDLIEPVSGEVVMVVATDDAQLESVLVSSRKGEPLAETEAPELEPISDFAEKEPELAEPPAENSPPSGSADQKVSPVALEEAEGTGSPRVAVLPENGERVLADVATAYRQENKPRPARFHSVTPGESNRDELIEAWGEPVRTAKADGQTAGGEVLGYDLKPFKQVEALVERDLVTVVRVTLAEDATVEDLTRRLKLTEIDPVQVTDPQTNELLAVAFPEKGLTLLVKPTSAAAPLTGSVELAGVSHLVLEPIDARAFVLRSEQRPEQMLKAKLKDLRLAIEADPSDAHAHWLAAGWRLDAGLAAASEEAAAEAVRLDPSNPAHRLALAEALRAGGEFDKSVIETRKVLDDGSAPEVVRAQALDLMGRLAAMGTQKIADKTIDFHNAAISIADKLATSTDDRERRTAKDVLVSAHLSIAREVARRDYADKASTVAEWIGRASGLAEDRIASDDGGLELRLQVARGALAALAEMRPTKDPAPWLSEAQDTAAELLSTSTDPLFRARVHWELGESYQHAVRIEHLRGDSEQALSYGTKAINELSAGAEPRTTSPEAEKLVGKLYFYLGAVNAVHKKDHAEAIGWYDRGREILTAETTPSDFVVPRREGEELVSMGVSYWDQGQRDLAVELTEAGARLMERGVTAGVVKERTLAVPYGNLHTMHGELENTSKASEYGRLARGVEPAATKPKPEAKPAAKQTAEVKKEPPQRSASTQAKREPAPPNPRLSRRPGRPTFKRTMMR
ncbi:hypothetical protein MalM25_01250 [Planctomycetes bacterium MalM25]|nr:hypothetical protein MalM25_01250 [Planctomycetes bacterium MalM25]